MRHRRIAFVAALVVAVSITLLSWVGLTLGTFQGYQLPLADQLFPAIGPDRSIAVVLIDDRSLDAVGQWPWNRSVHADLIRRLDSAGADRIGYDVTFTEPGDPAADRELTEAVREAGDVVLAANAVFEGSTGDVPEASDFFPPIGELPVAALAVGHVSVFPDEDGVVRRLAPVIQRPDGELLPALALALALVDPVKAQFSLARDGVRTLDGVIPTGDAHLMDINFAAEFDSYSAVEVLSGDLPDEAFEGRTVLVGASATGLGDYRLTPLDKRTGEPGVLIHANTLNTMLQGAYLRTDSTVQTLLWIFAIAFIVAFGVGYLRLWFTPLAPVAVGAAFLLLALRRFDTGAVPNLLYPMLAVGASAFGAIGIRYFTELRERRRVTRVFGRYLAKDVVEEVLAAPEEAVATLEGASPEISVLFADLRGFTSASENLPPAKVVTALNMFLDAMTRAVVEEQGTVDKFMGDCVMAFWNAPKAEPRHAERAVRAALLMQRYIDEAMQREEVSALAVKGCGVGIATGEAVVGNIGSAERLDYTVIGDTVNTASRLCGVADAGAVVITEACAAAIGDAFELAPMPPVAVKGKVEPLAVFRVTGGGTSGKLGPDASGRARGAGYAPVEPVTDDATT